MLIIIKPGIFSVIQDAGRFGYQQYGVITSGAMDMIAYRIGNALLQQHNKPALEMTLIGGQFQFTKETTIALTGGMMQAKLNGKDIPMNRAIPIQPNDLLTCGPIVQGARSYLSIAGGFTIKPILNSTSTYLKAGFGGFQGRPLKTGDAIPYERTAQRFKPLQVYTHNFYKARPVRILQGTEWSYFSEQAQQLFLQQPYTISIDSDRMGYRLESEQPNAAANTPQLLSEAVTFGTIQLPASGQPILLMADHQTTGGYPKIAQVIAADLPYAAQLTPKQSLTFELVTLQQAEQAYLEHQRQLRLLELLVAN